MVLAMRTILYRLLHLVFLFRTVYYVFVFVAHSLLILHSFLAAFSLFLSKNEKNDTNKVLVSSRFGC